MTQSVRRPAFIFLCAFPFVAGAFASVRALRTPELSRILGVVLFTTVVIATWLAGPRKVDLKETLPTTSEAKGPRKRRGPFACSEFSLRFHPGIIAHI